MSNEAYRKCKTCRFCNHRGDIWVCAAETRTTSPEETCGRYRPGCCENCNNFSNGICELNGEEMFELDVCTSYDPSGSV